MQWIARRMNIFPANWFREEEAPSKGQSPESDTDSSASPENGILHFQPKLPPSGSFDSIIARWAVVLFSILCFSPTAVAIFQLVRGDSFSGRLGLAVMLPVSAVLLFQIHKHGVIRLAISVPLFALACAIFWFIASNS